MGPHFKKTVTLDVGGRRLELRVAQDLFSSHEVDVGTRLLLRTLAGPEHGARRLVLDLGCGYGPLGLALRAAAADRVVHLVDRDALAVAYSRENAAANRLDGVEAYASLGYADVRAAGFDLVVSNIPAKAGPPVIERLLLGGAGLLAPGGLVAVVVIAPLRASVTAVLEGAPGVEVVFRRATASYAVFHYRFRGPGSAAGPAGPGPGGGRRRHQAPRVRVARVGRGRRGSTPPRRRPSPARVGVVSRRLASRGAREATAAQRGSQPRL